VGFEVERGFVGKPQFRFGRMAVLAVALAAAGLSGCGRKSGLDLPPTASLTDPQAAPPANNPNVLPIPGQPAAAPTQPASPPAPPKRFLLDFMLN
jgi:predicted small lipoprotein YifL